MKLDSISKVPSLDSSNYRLWSDSIRTVLQFNKLWRLVSGQEKRPTVIALPTDTSKVTPAAQEAFAASTKSAYDWDEKAEQAAAIMRFTISQECMVHIRAHEDDPIMIWTTLESTFIKQRAAPRFNAYQELFSIRKESSESLDSVINRVNEQVRIIQSLTPKTFTLDNLYDELSTMALIRSLPQDFSNVINTIAILDTFDKDKVITSLRNLDDTNKQLGSVLIASSSSHQQKKPNSSSKKNQANRPVCAACERVGHLEENCWLKKKIMAKLQDKTRANSASEDPTHSASISSASCLLSSPLDASAYTLWNSDTGASSHMTPHRHWLRNYKVCQVEIKLADGSSIYSEGVGTVLFEPVINGRPAQQVEFSNVLHVPALRNNLFSVLFLSMHKDFTIHIHKDTINFNMGNKVLFSAKVDPSSNAAYLQGTTIPISESANLSSSTTLPMDLELWHRRLCHPSYPVLRKMIREDLVTGLKITSDVKPDPICEPCLAGKMVADPFPSSSHRATHLLGLIHSDVHGPIRTPSHSGFIYWVTFIDDSGRFRVVFPMKKKSDTFSCFKRFKAWAENKTGHSVGTLREDKGGEYMGKEFGDFCIEHGIQRQHSVRARPQQNGVAERANRTMEQGIITMLHQAGLPLAFWGEALAAYVHVWNRTPTSAVPGKTPYENFYSTKPDVSMLRVWGCVAYVHIQRDKREGGSLGSHMEKCIFIGYPPDYKGWKFYNPATKKSIISERAQFDERYFLGIKESTPTIIPDTLLELPPTPTNSGQDPSSTSLEHLSVDSTAQSEDMQNYGGAGHGSNPPYPPPMPPASYIYPTPSLSPPHSRPLPHWLSSLSPQPPSSPQQHSTTPSPPRSPLPVTRPPTPVPHPQTPLLPIAQRRPARNPPPADWKESQYKVKNSEQYRDKPKRSRTVTPSLSPQPPQSSTLPLQPSTSTLSPPPWPSNLPSHSPQISTPPVEISLSPPPGQSSLPQPEPSPSTPSSPALWQQRNPTPAISSDDEDDSPNSAQDSSEEEDDDEDQDEDEDEDEEDNDQDEDTSDPNDDTYDPTIDETFYSTAYANLSSITEPKTFKASQKCPESSQWKKACLEELEAHRRNGTWQIVQLPPGKKVVGSKWVLRVKRNSDGSVERFKARLVAKGYSQRPGFDFTETFAPTVRYSAVRTILALAALEDMEIHSLDISNAYLNGVLEEEVYMQLPEGFEDIGRPGDVLLLKKATYGLKQAGRVWSKTLSDTLSRMGFTQIKSDPSVYVFLRDTLRIIIPVFVDDMTIICKSKSAIQAFIKELSSHFKLRDLGPTSQLLGIKIDRDRPSKTISLSQKQYILDMLERYGMSDCKPVSTPMSPGSKLSSSMAPSTPEDISFMKSVPYLSAVGSLMYLAITTRPDISYAVGVLARFNSNPGPTHWTAVKHVFRYLKGTLNLKLEYGPTADRSQEMFQTYSDADHGGNSDNGKSTGGYLVKLGTGAVSWSSKLQSMVALSTTEAEYISAVEAAKEILWIRQFMGELGYPPSSSSILLMDNQSAISVSKNPEHHGRMKHLDLRWYWLRDVVESGIVKPVFVPTEDMAADILTKSLMRPYVEKCRKLMGLT